MEVTWDAVSVAASSLVILLVGALWHSLKGHLCSIGRRVDNLDRKFGGLVTKDLCEARHDAVSEAVRRANGSADMVDLRERVAKLETCAHSGD